MGKQGVKFALLASARGAGFSAEWRLKLPRTQPLDGMFITKNFLCSAAMRPGRVLKICTFLGEGDEVFQLGADLYRFAELEVAVAGQ